MNGFIATTKESEIISIDSMVKDEEFPSISTSFVAQSLEFRAKLVLFSVYYEEVFLISALSLSYIMVFNTNHLFTFVITKVSLSFLI